MRGFVGVFVRQHFAPLRKGKIRMRRQYFLGISPGQVQLPQLGITGSQDAAALSSSGTAESLSPNAEFDAAMQDTAARNGHNILAWSLAAVGVVVTVVFAATWWLRPHSG